MVSLCLDARVRLSLVQSKLNLKFRTLIYPKEDRPKGLLRVILAQRAVVTCVPVMVLVRREMGKHRVRDR